MRAFKVLFVAVIVIAVFAVAAQAEETPALNVKITGLNKVENYIVRKALTYYKLPLTTPISVHKEVFTADWNGQDKEFDRITVSIETVDGKFSATLDTREFPQLPEEYHYGLLEQTLTHVCQKPEIARENARLDKAFEEAKKAVTDKATKDGFEVKFHDRHPGATEATFELRGKEIGGKVICKVNFAQNVNYSVLSKEHYFLQVRSMDDIFAPESKRLMATK